MQKENTILKATIVALSIITLSALVVWNRTNQENIRLRSRNELIREEKYKVINERDSLEVELFTAQNILFRYDMSLDSLRMINAKAERQFKTILNSEQYE